MFKAALVFIFALSVIASAYAGGGVILLLGGQQGSASTCSTSLNFSQACNSMYIPNRS